MWGTVLYRASSPSRASLDLKCFNIFYVVNSFIHGGIIRLYRQRQTFTIKISGNQGFIVQGTILMHMESNLCVSPVILALYKGSQLAKLKVL